MSQEPTYIFLHEAGSPGRVKWWPLVWLPQLPTGRNNAKGCFQESSDSPPRGKATLWDALVPPWRTSCSKRRLRGSNPESLIFKGLPRVQKPQGRHAPLFVRTPTYHLSDGLLILSHYFPAREVKTGWSHDNRAFFNFTRACVLATDSETKVQEGQSYLSKLAHISKMSSYFNLLLAHPNGSIFLVCNSEHTTTLRADVSTLSMKKKIRPNVHLDNQSLPQPGPDGAHQSYLLIHQLAKHCILEAINPSPSPL